MLCSSWISLVTSTVTTKNILLPFVSHLLNNWKPMKRLLFFFFFLSCESFVSSTILAWSSLLICYWFWKTLGDTWNRSCSYRKILFQITGNHFSPNCSKFTKFQTQKGQQKQEVNFHAYVHLLLKPPVLTSAWQIILPSGSSHLSSYSMCQ